MKIRFLTVEEVIELHQVQIELSGGAVGLRDLGLLESAVHMPQAGYGGQYFHEFPHEMAAAYLFHLAKNPAFLDGNKRIGLASALTFLELNQYRCAAPKARVESLVMAVARSEADKGQVSAFFRQHLQKRRKD